MNKRKLGATGIEVSEIAFGGVEIGMPYGAHKEDRLTDDEAVRLLHNAVEKGITFFDTARGYGRSEEIMGKAFADMRDEVVICTKCAHLKDTDGNLKTAGNIGEYIEDSIKTSLDKLRIDQVDVFLSHTADNEILNNKEVVQAFKSVKDRGLTKAVGVSTYGYADTKTAIDSGDWDVVQLAFNLMDQSCGQLFPSAQKNGVGIMVRSVLMRGILTDSPIEFHEKLESVRQQREQLKVLLSPEIDSLSDLATKFVLSFDAVSAALVGIDKQKFLDDAVRLADGNYLDGELLRKAKELAYPDPAFLNMGMWNKNGWLV